jgi:hypothetical protein
MMESAHSGGKGSLKFLMRVAINCIIHSVDAILGAQASLLRHRLIAAHSGPPNGPCGQLPVGCRVQYSLITDVEVLCRMLLCAAVSVEDDSVVGSGTQSVIVNPLHLLKPCQHDRLAEMNLQNQIVGEPVVTPQFSAATFPNSMHSMLAEYATIAPKLTVSRHFSFSELVPASLVAVALEHFELLRICCKLVTNTEALWLNQRRISWKTQNERPQKRSVEPVLVVEAKAELDGGLSLTVGAPLKSKPLIQVIHSVDNLSVDDDGQETDPTNVLSNRTPSGAYETHDDSANDYESSYFQSIVRLV